MAYVKSFADYHDISTATVRKGYKTKEVAFGWAKMSAYCRYWFLIYKGIKPSKAEITKLLVKAGFVKGHEDNEIY